VKSTTVFDGQFSNRFITCKRATSREACGSDGARNQDKTPYQRLIFLLTACSGLLPQVKDFETALLLQLFFLIPGFLILNPYFFNVVSKSLNMRLYSSVQLLGCTKPWSSTGYDASSQLSLCNSIRRCVKRTISW